MQATLDTGATVSLLAYRVGQQQNLLVNKLKKPSLVNTSGLPMQVQGTANVTLCANNIFTNVDAVISSDLCDDLLIGCEDLRQLKIIPSNFPHQTVGAVTTLSSMKQSLLDKFPETLSDSLSPVPMKTADGDMHISMDRDAIPHQEVVARRYKPQTDIVVEDLISKNIITKVEKPTKWVSPAFFVHAPGNGLHKAQQVRP